MASDADPTPAGDHPQPDAAPQPSLTRWQRRSKAAGDALRTLIRDLFADRFGEAPPTLVDLPITLRLQVRPTQNWELSFDPDIGDQLLAQFEDAQAGQDVFSRGAVYCFRCSSSDCEHAKPLSPLTVFAGYDSAGRPTWREFTQALVERRDGRVDRLFAPKPQVLALLQLGSELRGEQLASFGRSSKTYAVLGQVSAGYFQRADTTGEPHRVAVTLQVVESRGANGGLKLHLNDIAALPGELSLAEALADGWAPSLFRARAVASRELESLEGRIRAARAAGRYEDVRDALRRVPGVLKRIAENLERGDRQAQRRTKHAEERREDRRPVSKAMDDVRAATPEKLFYDERSQALVVVGEKGRAHVFNDEGRHVTSFTLKQDGIDFRVRNKRWRIANPGEWESFRTAIPPRPKRDDEDES